MSSVTRYTYDYEGEMVQVATDRQGLASGVEIYVNIARMLFETLEGQVFKVHKTKYGVVYYCYLEGLINTLEPNSWI